MFLFICLFVLVWVLLFYLFIFLRLAFDMQGGIHLGVVLSDTSLFLIFILIPNITRKPVRLPSYFNTFLKALHKASGLSSYNSFYLATLLLKSLLIPLSVLRVFELPGLTFKSYVLWVWSYIYLTCLFSRHMTFKHTSQHCSFWPSVPFFGDT